MLGRATAVVFQMNERPISPRHYPKRTGHSPPIMPCIVSRVLPLVLGNAYRDDVVIEGGYLHDKCAARHDPPDADLPCEEHEIR